MPSLGGGRRAVDRRRSGRVRGGRVVRRVRSPAPPRTGRSRRGCRVPRLNGPGPRSTRRRGRFRRRGRVRWWGTGRRRCASRARSARSCVAQVRRVDDGGARTEHTVVTQQGGRACIRARPCSPRPRRSVRTRGRAAVRRVACAHSATVRICSVGTARTEWIAAATSTSSPSSRSVDALGPALGGAVAEALLRSRRERRAVEAGAEIAGVEQGQPDPGFAGGVDQRMCPSRSGRRTAGRRRRGAGSGIRRRR